MPFDIIENRFSIYYVYLAGIILALVLASQLYRTLSTPIARIPGPWHTLWSGAAFNYYRMTGRGAFYVQRLHEKYGPVVRVNPKDVDVSDVAAAREIHSVKNGYLKSPWYDRFVGRGSESIFSTRDVDFHRRHRRLLSMPMSESSLRAVEPKVRARAALAVQRIGEEMKSRGAGDIFKWWLFYTTDVIGELSFGESFRMLDIGKKNQYIIDLENISRQGALRVSFPLLHDLSKFIPLPLFRQAEEAILRRKAYGEQSIQRYKNIAAADPENMPTTLFSRLFQAGEEGLSDKEILSDAQAYIVAGSDVTANTLTFMVWSICRQDTIRNTLLSELQALPDDFDHNHLKALPYLNQVIDETLRRFSAAPSGLPRVVPQGGSELAGYWFPAGATVTTQAYSLHRDPKIFPNPEVFDPSRWANPTKQMKDAFFVFGGGSRVCLGMHLARMEMQLAVALFFRAFPQARMSTLEGMSEEDMEERVYFFLTPKHERCLMQAS